jgi:hypothetical protein
VEHHHDHQYPAKEAVAGPAKTFMSRRREASRGPSAASLNLSRRASSTGRRGRSTGVLSQCDPVAHGIDLSLLERRFGGNLSESRSRNFSREDLTIFEGMEKIVAQQAGCFNVAPIRPSR